MSYSKPTLSYLKWITSILFFAFLTPLKAQLAYSPFVDSISSISNAQSILLLTRQLAGDTTVSVDGQIVTISSRHYLSNGNALAAQFIYEKFEEYGYQPEYQYFNGTRGINVIATKIGTRYPEQEYIICGHYDNMPSGPIAPGADDNASGTVAVMEAARILSNIDLDYTVRFAAWDEEEIGLIGSEYYAELASQRGDDILGVLNLDMIAWDSDNDMVYSIATNPNSAEFTNDFLTTTGYYQPLLSNNFINTTASDHASFWQFGYPAILAIEDFSDFNAYYHTPEDDIAILNMPLYEALVRASIANLAANALNQRYGFLHDPIISSNSTQTRETSVIILNEHATGTGANLPRLYYSIDSVTFNYVLPTVISVDTFSFEIPGFPMGTVVQYYFAVQDSAATMIATFPSGGQGINPPGTVAPTTFFSYEVANVYYTENCSGNVPLLIPDNSNTYDQFNVIQAGDLLDIDVLIDISHPADEELRIILISPDNTSMMLSDRNGGDGDNYMQTIFDDQAMMSIAEGTAPFTGRFRPDQTFNSYLNKPFAGQWKLRIVESGFPNSGMLNQWCLHFLYEDLTIGTSDITLNNKIQLQQNYPNPSNSTTSIKFTLPEATDISLAIFDNMGRKVRTLASGRFLAGDHLVVASVNDLQSGNYFYTLKCHLFTETKQMTIVR